ncbi:MAG: hypothetical protein ACE3L7_15805 [Candidatus Pristimantibacillus sp.]
MLEITGNDIKDLSDTDLRSLIGLLCEAELSIAGLPIAGVTWGGHQNASDGGIDVRVDVTSDLHEDSFVPRSHTGYQVKKPDMPRSAIIEEMRPNGELRQVLKDLADVGGAYIIVSSQGSTADSSLKNRREAMRESFSDYINATQIKTDFYDRDRVAGWVRSHPSLILWVRDKIGQPIQGWKTYGNWSDCPGGVNEEYLLDGHTRLYNAAIQDSEGLSVTDGINQLRNILNRTRASVRLVGLSGVGKTRLIQSLFDERIGENPLNQTQVFYSDISDSPNPDPRNFAERLIVLQKPLILIVDNCPPELHRRLTSICSASGSLISLITIEYDVKDDQPEETEVFRLEPASSELIEKVILARFDYISQVEARSISEFSGGNARIAIALCKTITKGEDISRLRDHELFERLFQQRNVRDSKLLKVAEVCSLVYSFDCSTGETNDIELRLLGSLVDLDVRTLYENVVELKRRDLVQQRSNWRAVLPHAVANRLAERALENIPLDFLIKVFEQGGCERLLQSFSRRIGFLHNNKIVQEIVKKWISTEGILSEITDLNELGIGILRNIAPVNPELTLSAIERIEGEDAEEIFFSRSNTHFYYYTRLLRSIAYDPNLFDRASKLLSKFALTETTNENNNSIRSLYKSLFYLFLSGTHATAEQRLRVIDNLLNSDNVEKVDLGISLLSAALESWHFTSHYNFEFGARARDYGYSPRNKEAIYQWYKVFLDYSTLVAVSNEPLAAKVRALLAEKFRGLWTRVKMYDDLEATIKTISVKVSWSQGWLVVKSTKKFDAEKMTAEVQLRLDSLAKILAPTILIDRIRAFTLSGNRHIYGLLTDVQETEEKASDSFRNLDEMTRVLGNELGIQYETLNELLPELLISDGRRIYYLGQGLADGCVSPRDTWNIILYQISLIPDSERNYQLLRGFINAVSKSDINLSEDILDDSVTNKEISRVFPIIQSSVDVTVAGFERLKHALNKEVAPIWTYRNLAYGSGLDSLSDVEFCELIKQISTKMEGIEVAIEVLHTRLPDQPLAKVSELIVSLGQDLLVQYSYSSKNSVQMDYELESIMKFSFAKEESAENARLIARKIAKSRERYEIYSLDYVSVLAALASLHPLVFLDVFLGEAEEPHYLLNQIDSSENLLAYIHDEIIIKWCDVDQEARYFKVAAVIEPFYKVEKENILKWTPLAMILINNVLDPVIILNELKSTFRPRSWDGSRSDLMQTRLPLLIELQKHENSVVVNWAKEEERKFIAEIRSEREWEQRLEKGKNERFE